MGKRYAVIGLGRFGQKLALSIEEHGGEVIAVDNAAARVDAVKDNVSVAVELDCTDKNALMSQGIHQVDVAIVCVGENFEANVLCTMLLKEMGVKKVLARAAMGIQTQILQAIGVDQIIHPEEEAAEKLSRILTFRPLIDYLHLSSQLNVAQVEAPKEFWEKTIAEIEIRKNFGVNVVVVRHAENPDEGVIPGPETVIRKGDVLLLVGPEAKINKMVAL